MFNSSPFHSYWGERSFSSRAKIGPTLLFFTKWKLLVHLEICERQAKNPQSGKVFFYSFFLCMQPFFSRLMQVLFIGEVCLLSSSILEVIKNGSQSCSVKAMQGSSWCALFCKKHTCLKSQNKQIDWGVESDFLDNLAQYCCWTPTRQCIYPPLTSYV